ERAEWRLGTEERNDDRGAQARLNRCIPQSVTRPLGDVGDLQRLARGDCLAEPSLTSSNVELAKSSNDLVVQTGGLAEFEPADIRVKVEDRAAISAREFYSTIDNGFQHHFEIKCRADRSPNFAQRCKIAIPSLHLLE